MRSNSSITVYPETMHLKSMVHLQDNGQRPKVILEETDHPLSVHQRNGIDIETLLGMMHALEKQAQTV